MVTNMTTFSGYFRGSPSAGKSPAVLGGCERALWLQQARVQMDDGLNHVLSDDDIIRTTLAGNYVFLVLFA